MAVGRGPFKSHLWKWESTERRRFSKVDWISERIEATRGEEERRRRFVGGGEGEDGGRFKVDDIGK